MLNDAPLKTRFHMPVIAPAPKDYQGTAPAYYAEVAQQCATGALPIPVEPELIVALSASPSPKGLQVTLANPDGVFQYQSGGQGPAPPPWRTLFAMTGGFLTYVPSTVASGLGPWLPPPFDSIASPFVPTAPAGLATARWGTLVLRLWGPDVARMQRNLDAGPACGVLYYVGVAEDSLAMPVAGIVSRLFPKERFDSSAAEGKQPTLRRVLEKMAGTPYPTMPGYTQLVTDYVARFVAGETSLMVEGGQAIGKTVLVSPGGGGGVAGEISLWAVDASTAPAFADVAPYFWSGASSS